MNVRTFIIIAALTSITLAIFQQFTSAAFSLASFIWQDVLAILIICMLAREAGAAENSSKHVVSIVVNAEGKKQNENYENHEEIQTEEFIRANEIIRANLDTNTDEITTNYDVTRANLEATDKLMNLIESLAKKIGDMNLSQHSNQVKPLLSVAPASIVRPQFNTNININSPKHKMLKNIFDENINLQKKAS